MERVSQLAVTYIINSAWLMLVICGLALLGSLMLRRTPAKWSHLLWVSALLMSSLLPLWSLRQTAPEPQPKLTFVDSQTEIAQAETSLRATAGTGSQTRQSWFHVPQLSPLVARPGLVWAITGSYCIFLLYRLIRVTVAGLHTRTLRRMAAGSSAEGNLQSVVERYSADLRLRRAPPVFLTEGVGPLTIGIRNPILLVPSAFSAVASEEEMNAAVCHELAHIKRHDFLLNLACELILLPICYHPAAALIKARIDRSRELACDDMAAAILASSAVYARSLVSIAKSMSSSVPVPTLGYGQGLFDTERMEERIVNLIGKRAIISNHGARALAVASVSLLGVISVAAATLTVQVAPQTAPVTSSAGASSQLSPQNAGSAEMPADAQKARPTTMPPVAEPSATMQISIRKFALLGGEIPGANEALSQDLRSRTYGKNIAREIAEQVRNFYQERGYFKAIPSEPKISQDGSSSVDVTISVNAGQQYRLTDVQFTGNKVFTTAELRALFPIQPGEVFKPSAIRAGLNAMRSLYASNGLTNVVPTVETKIDDTTRTILVNVVADEGHIASFSVPLPPQTSAQSAPEQNLPGYYKVGNGVSAPIAIYTPAPPYNSVARAARAEGIGVFQIGVGADGSVQMARALFRQYPTLHPSLIQSGVDTLRAWKFQPALKDGQPVPAQLRVEINFRLN